ncbi:hypothetical protein X925_04820 [Petrotoga sp. 9T1HF07.CasAA.8.2]|jgi:transposase InsO family protein|uniref:IS3 family transposase n=1 Tax=Petrotoga sp. 9T1HF07.CasAA.8.2 TaxID=1434329 RepID=UPI00074A1D67|nr:IS3 family transposase [Petrotoga sp. 9T1HF07.CasAA.8.2]KUK15029.1 MAG: hypothetical protein XD53_1544 [Petrotoga mobilis]PNR88894.1 hypothetical protein X925_04820 [Petrotoga sp. 9T1HF07.CasAA.8.2]
MPWETIIKLAHCIDNGPLEGFWGVYEERNVLWQEVQSKEELIEAISNYMDYFVNKRVQRRLGAMTPSEYYKMKIAI